MTDSERAAMAAYLGDQMGEKGNRVQLVLRAQQQEPVPIGPNAALPASRAMIVEGEVAGVDSELVRMRGTMNNGAHSIEQVVALSEILLVTRLGAIALAKRPGIVGAAS